MFVYPVVVVIYYIYNTLHWLIFGYFCISVNVMMYIIIYHYEIRSHVNNYLFANTKHELVMIGFDAFFLKKKW